MFKKQLKHLNIWSQGHLLGLFVFNTILIVLVLLNVAGYFKPFFHIGVNFIFFSSLILSIFLLGFRYRAMLIVSMTFFVLAMFLKVVKIDVWSDRASIYYYQSFVLTILLLLTNKPK